MLPQANLMQARVRQTGAKPRRIVDIFLRAQGEIPCHFEVSGGTGVGQTYEAISVKAGHSLAQRQAAQVRFVHVQPVLQGGGDATAKSVSA